jgi:hypothetical protein
VHTWFDPRRRHVEEEKGKGTERNIYELGHFEGDVWVFNEPFMMPHGTVAEKIDLSQLEIPEDSGITRSDLIHALTDPRAIAVPASDDDVPEEVRDELKKKERRMRWARTGGPKMRI